jgi:hypothetical protein
MSGQLETPAAELRPPPGEKNPLLSFVAAWMVPDVGFKG